MLPSIGLLLAVPWLSEQGHACFHNLNGLALYVASFLIVPVNSFIRPSSHVSSPPHHYRSCVVRDRVPVITDSPLSYGRPGSSPLHDVEDTAHSPLFP